MTERTEIAVRILQGLLAGQKYHETYAPTFGHAISDAFTVADLVMAEDAKGQQKGDEIPDSEVRRVLGKCLAGSTGYCAGDAQ